MSMASGSIDHLQKLTVAQLKSLCKEKNLVGYSKLTKHAIMQKLIDEEKRSKSPSTEPNAALFSTSAHFVGQPINPGAQLRVINEKRIHHQVANRNTTALSHQDSSISPHIAEDQPSISTGSHIGSALQPSLTTTPFVSTSAITSPKILETPDHSNKRLMESSTTLLLTSKKQKCTITPTLTITQAAASPLIPKIQNTQAPLSGHSQPPPYRTNDKLGKSINPMVDSVAPSLAQALQDQNISKPVFKGKRFIPLAIRKKGDSTQKQSSITRPCPPSSPYEDRELTKYIQGLDFTNFHPMLLQPVSYPPSLSQRKGVPNLALFLSSVSVKDLGNCARVSRLFRYAAYISAVHRLKQDFPGRRLESILQQYSLNMTNMWPYLRQRETELFMRKQIYRESFLNRALKGYDRISARLWTSPDNAKQITVAIRFLLTQLYFSISITNETCDQFKSKIVDTQELVLGELWSITVSSTKSVEVYYVLEATCEVVGRSPLKTSILPENSLRGLLPIRADWSAYIDAQSLSSSPVKISLMSHLKWTNHEEYDRGLSRVWLKRVQDEGELGEVKLVVAGRYVLACVVANSVSGPWMSSLNMAQEFNGMASCLPEMAQNMRIQLFLPAHHHVESLHFTTCKGEPLHPALAAVQTPAREYYIFRDNGMQVGCEEDGVARVWMQILGCDAFGRLCHN